LIVPRKFNSCALLALLVLSPPAKAQQRSLAEDAAAFGARARVEAARLAPDGSKILYLTPGPGPKTFAAMTDLASGQTQVITASDGNPEHLRWCNFAALDRIVCAIDGNVDMQGLLVGMQRLVALGIDGSQPKLLGQPERYTDAYIRQFDAAVLDWRNGTDGRILMEREYVPEVGKIGSNIIDSRQGLGVDLVDTRTLRATAVERPNKSASGYATDGRGNVRLMSVVEVEGDQLTGRIKYFYRAPGSRDWKTLVDYQREQFVPLAVDADLDALYALKKRNGRYALYRVKLDGSLQETLIAEDPRVDIEGVVRSGDGQRVIGYSYEDAEQGETIYFDPEYKALAQSLSKALPNLPLIHFADASADGRKLLLFAGSDNDPGRYYVFDKVAKTLNETMVSRPELEGRMLARYKSVTVPAPDGAQIPAYLTLPPGKDPKNLPAVVLPHGGPSARDYWGFDPLSQFLAARGYVVIQPQYRGSAGFGDGWKNENGFKNWRTAMSDIEASARWLGTQGIANPNRIAIFGWSYGGYAALLEAATNPELYKAVIAVAPVTDLQLLKDDAREYTSHRAVEEFVGSGPHVVEGSPLQKAGAIRAPVLLAHGDLDTNVAFHHSSKMYEALKSHGKAVEFLSFRGLDHQLEDPAAMSQVFTKMGELLERTIGR
jgi:dipeptidyl aminopeptidase/acylaminoacyl peptidase